MFIFVLVFAHFIADYVLQSTWIWKAKITSRWAMFVHCFLYAGCIGFALYGWTNCMNWFTISAVFNSHWLIDKFRIWLNGKRWWAADNDWFPTFVDQLLHFLVLAIIIFKYR